MNRYTIAAGGVTYARRAWTGGDVPPRGLRRRSAAYRALARAFFREQISDANGCGFFVGASLSWLSWARILWNRARLDAWRTLENHEKSGAALTGRGAA